MKPLGVNRVVIAVKDLDRAIQFYSRLLGATFEDVSAGAEVFGVRAAISWDAGIELVAPLPGRDSAIARSIEKHGEGVRQIVFAVDDIEEARARIEAMDIRILETIEFSEKQLEHQFHGRFARYKEHILHPADTGGAPLIIAQFNPR
jgi:catechol 2,3-dioxygenase-like lactoylglutathione lyase family enzyme